MGYLIRFILLVIVAWVVISFVKKLLKRSGVLEDEKTDKPPASLKSEATTKCAYCGTYTPKSTAITRAGADYCCEEHAKLQQDRK